MGVLLLADRRFERHRLLRYLEDVTHLIDGHTHLCGDLLRRGVVTQLLKKLAGHSYDLVYRFDHVDGDPYGACLIRYRTGYRLTYPPGRIGRELVALGVVELLDRLYKTEVALLNEVGQRHSPADVALCDGDDEAQICLRHQSARLLVALTHFLGGGKLLLRREQRHLADVTQVHTHRVGGVGVGVLNLGGEVGAVVLDGRQQILGADVDLDACGVDRIIEACQRLGGRTRFLGGGDVLCRNSAALFGAFQKLRKHLVGRRRLFFLFGQSRSFSILAHTLPPHEYQFRKSRSFLLRLG